MINMHALEEFAMGIREALKIESNVILTPSHFEEIREKIEKFNDVEIKASYSSEDSYVFLENGIYSIYLGGNEENQFYDLIKMICYAFMFDTKSLTVYELKRRVVIFPRGLSEFENTKICERVMRAVMLPSEVFRREMIKYEDPTGSSVKIVKMNKEVNKYCYARAVDLGLIRP